MNRELLLVDPPLNSISLGFDVSAKGEVQPFIKVTAIDVEEAEILLSKGIKILREQGYSMKVGVKEINIL